MVTVGALRRSTPDVTAVQRDRAILALTIFVVLFAQVLLYPGVTDLVTALGAVGDLDASTWFLGSEFAAFVLFAGLWGVVSDRTGRRVPFIVAGAIGGSAGYAALVVIGGTPGATFESVIVVRFLQGAATISAFSLAMTMLMDLEGGNGQNMGAAGIAIGLGTASGAPVGGALTEIGPLVPLWVASGALLLAGLLALLLVDRAPTGQRVGLRSAVRRLRETPALGFPYAFGFMDRLTAGFFALVGTVYFRDVFDLDAAGAGIMLGLFFVPFALLQYPFGVLSDRVGRQVPVAVGSICYGGAVLAVYLAPTVWLAGATMVLLGVLGALISPATMALVSDLSGDADRGVAMGGFNVFGNLGFLAGFVVGSVVTDSFGYGAAFATAGLLEAGIVVVALPAFLRLDLARTATFTE
ncbi:Major Facilitator Superfamily protein [Halomicrobium zhouii]|uniref:Major Facilitator Superfamily protein n=1 Tax=Halomicrobium zhouii TaxID=767519 RepID=A0A1I6KFV2_9EURY|nr:MFS transporter [Halomicrobium zhouii]SFR89928.1 Major Facilitator Superfamily protein [Halomicrobium zhouii]